MNEIDKLIEADQTNCQQSIKLFKQFDSLIVTSFDDAANLFNVFSRSFSHGATDDDTQHSFSKLAKEGGITESEIVEVLNDKKPSSISDDLFEDLSGKIGIPWPNL